MNNYTSEQRKMIADFLESKILPFASKTNRTEPFSTNTYWVNKEEITNTIKELRTPRFEDIKNETGVKFRAPSVFGPERAFMVSAMIKDNSCIPEFIVSIGICGGIIHPISKVPDDTIVEIID